MYFVGFDGTFYFFDRQVFEQVDDFVIGCVLATKQVFEYHVFIFIDLACSKNQFRFVI